MSVQFCCLAKNRAEVRPATPTVLDCSARLLEHLHWVEDVQVALGSESEEDACQLLLAGAQRVFLADAALRDSTVITRLVKRFGNSRIGLHVPVQRQAVSWSFETESNADFSVVTPSLCEPTWEVLKADGQSSGVRAIHWVEAMLQHGVSSVLLRADLQDDADLNLCAGLIEMAGDRLWVGPRTQTSFVLGDWIDFAHVTRVALPAALYARRHTLLHQRSQSVPPGLPTT